MPWCNIRSMEGSCEDEPFENFESYPNALIQPSKLHLGMCLSAVALSDKCIFPALKNASGLSRMLMQLWSVSRHQSTFDFWL